MKVKRTSRSHPEEVFDPHVSVGHHHRELRSTWIEFESVYCDIIAPALKDAGFETIRPDQEEINQA